jgi:hypothetical protein
MADERGYIMRVPALAQFLQLATLISLTDGQPARQCQGVRVLPSQRAICSQDFHWFRTKEQPVVLDHGGLKTRKSWSTRPGLVQTSRSMDKVVVLIKGLDSR